MVELDALEGPRPAGGPPPAWERCARADELQAKVRATNRIRCVRFTDASSILFSGLAGKRGSNAQPFPGSLLFVVRSHEKGKRCKALCHNRVQILNARRPGALTAQ